jgi:hypothetical protein
LGLRAITDKDLAVYLSAKGIDIKSIEKDPKANRSLILFEDNEVLNKSIIDFANKNDNINIAEFLAAERRIKTLLCAQKN